MRRLDEKIRFLFFFPPPRWVNETYQESCLELAEELANQTPVRLDLLLTIAPGYTNGDAGESRMDTSIVSG